MQEEIRSVHYAKNNEIMFLFKLKNISVFNIIIMTVHKITHEKEFPIVSHAFYIGLLLCI